MKKVDQTRMGAPGGNCFQAAVASILELPLEEVPDFCNLETQDWESALNGWLYPRGLFALHVDLEKSDPDTMEWLISNAIVLAAVKSRNVNGALHSVVYHKGKVIHDPHPAKAHMESKPVSFDVFVAIDPARAMNKQGNAL